MNQKVYAHSPGRLANAVESILDGCRGRETVTILGRLRAVDKLSGGALSFRHKVWDGASESALLALASSSLFSLPSDYIELLRYANGMSLHYGTINIYGVGCEFSRPLSLEDDTPLRLEDHGDKTNQSSGLSLRVGGISGYHKQLGIVLKDDGSCCLENRQDVRSFDGFSECLIYLLSGYGNVSATIPYGRDDFLYGVDDFLSANMQMN